MAWNVDGIVDGLFQALVYNAPSETLLAQFERKVAERHFVGSLYVRGRSETEYRKLFGPDDLTSARDLVGAEAAPVAYFLIWTHTRESPDGSDWKALARIDLESLSVTEVITGFTGEWDGAWISKVQSVSADATSLLCVVGRSKPRPGSTARAAGFTVDYFLCRVDVATAAVEPITLLRSTFF